MDDEFGVVGGVGGWLCHFGEEMVGKFAVEEALEMFLYG